MKDTICYYTKPQPLQKKRVWLKESCLQNVYEIHFQSLRFSFYFSAPHLESFIYVVTHMARP